MTNSPTFIGICCAFLAVISAGGCASMPETRFFVLALAPEKGENVRSDVTVGTVSLPAYLKSDGIALATAPHTVRHARFHRWAEPLDEGIARTLRADLSRRVGMQTWVEVDVQFFHGDPDGNVLLQARWLARLPCGDPASGQFAGKAQQATNGYSSMVATQAELVRQMSMQIAGAIVRPECNQSGTT